MVIFKVALPCALIVSTMVLLKIVRIIWFFSVVAALAGLLYNYAGLPDPVDIFTEPREIPREVFFYFFTLLLLLINVMVFIVGFFYRSAIAIRIWTHTLVISMNCFLIALFFLVGLINSSENFNYSYIGWILYGSLSLVIVAAISLPVYYIFKNKFSKPAF